MSRSKAFPANPGHKSVVIGKFLQHCKHSNRGSANPCSSPGTHHFYNTRGRFGGAWQPSLHVRIHDRGIHDYRCGKHRSLERSPAILDACTTERRMGHSSHPTSGRLAARTHSEKTCKRRSQALSQTSKVHREVAFWKRLSDFCSMMAVFGVWSSDPLTLSETATMNWK